MISNGHFMVKNSILIAYVSNRIRAIDKRID